MPNCDYSINHEHPFGVFTISRIAQYLIEITSPKPKKIMKISSWPSGFKPIKTQNLKFASSTIQPSTNLELPHRSTLMHLLSQTKQIIKLYAHSPRRSFVLGAETYVASAWKSGWHLTILCLAVLAARQRNTSEDVTRKRIIWWTWAKLSQTGVLPCFA